MSLLLEACALSHVYPDGSVGLDGCSLAIRTGSRNALLGSNGSGKTSLLLHFNALLQPTAGGVRFAGQPVDYRRSGLNALRRRVGLVFQNPDRQLFSASVIEDVFLRPAQSRAGRSDGAPPGGRGAGRRRHERAGRQAGAPPEFRPEKTRLHCRRAGHAARGIAAR